VLTKARRLNPRQEEFEKGLRRWLCGDLRPFSIVEDPHFIDLVRFIDPKLVVPRRDAVTTDCDNDYIESVDKVRLRDLCLLSHKPAH
jgi:hypothetical protein